MHMYINMFSTHIPYALKHACYIRWLCRVHARTHRYHTKAEHINNVNTMKVAPSDVMCWRCSLSAPSSGSGCKWALYTHRGIRRMDSCANRRPTLQWYSKDDLALCVFYLQNCTRRNQVSWTLCVSWHSTLQRYNKGGRRASSTGEGFDHPIDPAQQMHLQFRLCSIPTSAHLIHQRLWYLLFSL